MPFFRKKPVVIEAVQFTPGEGPRPGEEWLRRDDFNPFVCEIEIRDGENVIKVPPLHAAIRTLEGLHLVSPGDWVIRGVKGELYPCKPDIFAATYEPSKEDDDGE